MLVSTRGRYALRVVIDMAEHQAEGLVPLGEVARRQGVSEKYLESIVRLLVRGGILTGQRGKGGGYRLSRPPEHCTAGDILRLTEGSLAPVACLAPQAPACQRRRHCRTLAMWRGLEQALGSYLDGFTVADLMGPEEAQEKQTIPCPPGADRGEEDTDQC